MRSVPVGVLVCAGLLLSTAACADGPGGGGSTRPIRIGTSLPLTGEFSQPGKAARQGYEVWRAIVNAKGGLLGRRVELVIKDDASDQNTIVADYNALIGKNRVDLLLGTFSSLLNLPASAVAERNRRLFVEPAGGAPELFSRGFRFLFFAQQATSDKQGKVFAEWVAALPEGQRPRTAAYPTLDDPFTGPNSRGIEAILSRAGVTTVYRQAYPADTRNFDTIVSAMRAGKPDLVVQGAQFEDGVGLVRSMLTAGFKPRLLYQTNAPSMNKQYADAIGAGNTEGVMFAASHAPGARTPGNAEFTAKYEEMFGASPPEDAADAYAAGQVLEAAVKATGGVADQQALADHLRASTVPTILGPLTWNQDGSPDGEFLIGQWQHNRIEFVLPRRIATTDKIVMSWLPGGGS